MSAMHAAMQTLHNRAAAAMQKWHYGWCSDVIAPTITT
jgi:hypothetical protein